MSHRSQDPPANVVLSNPHRTRGGRWGGFTRSLCPGRAAGSEMAPCTGCSAPVRDGWASGFLGARPRRHLAQVSSCENSGLGQESVLQTNGRAWLPSICADRGCSCLIHRRQDRMDIWSKKEGGRPCFSLGTCGFGQLTGQGGCSQQPRSGFTAGSIRGEQRQTGPGPLSSDPCQSHACLPGTCRLCYRSAPPSLSLLLRG